MQYQMLHYLVWHFLWGLCMCDSGLLLIKVEPAAWLRPDLRRSRREQLVSAVSALTKRFGAWKLWFANCVVQWEPTPGRPHIELYFPFCQQW